ncbi:MAG: YceI family protein [Acidobacteriaceae bacterium]
MKRRLFSLAAVAGLCLSGMTSVAQTSSWTIDPAHSNVEFQIRHLGVSNVHGALTGLKGTVQLDEKDVTKSSVSATIETSTVSTSNDARDKHLKSPDFFDIGKYPQISFKSSSLSNAGGKLQMTGDLTLNGVTKPVTLDVDGPAPPQKGMGGKTVSGFSGTGTIKRSDFNFGSKYAPPMLGDDVKFTIDIEIGKS